jgi:hypothetical protein
MMVKNLLFLLSAVAALVGSPVGRRGIKGMLDARAAGRLSEKAEQPKSLVIRLRMNRRR